MLISVGMARAPKTKKPNGEQAQLPLDQRVTTLMIRINALERDVLAVRELLTHLLTTVATAEKMRR